MPCLALVLDCFLSAWTHVKDFKQEYEPVLFVLFRHSFVNVCKQMWKQEFLATAVLRTPRFAQFSFPHLHIFTPRLFLFPLANIVYSRTNGSYLQLFRFLLRFLPKTNSFTHVINTEVRNAEFNFNAKAFRRSLKNERIDCYFESFFVQDIPDEVFDLYCWIHSTYTIPRALRSLYILVISSATGTEGKHIDKWPPHFSNTHPILTKIIPNVTPWILSAPHLLPKKICPIIPLAFFILQLHLE